MFTRTSQIFAAVAALALLASACGGSETDAGAASADVPTADVPTAVVTTNILGDVVANIVGDQMNVETIMPVGADPHDFQASAQQVAAIERADVLITNGAGFEEGLLDVIASAEADGVLTHEAIDAVATIEFSEDGHDEHDDHSDEEGHDEHDDHSDEDEHDDHSDEDDHDDHSDEDDHDDHDDHSDEDDHDDHADEDDHEDGHDKHAHDGDDPHFFTDPARMVDAAQGIADFLIANVEDIDADALRSSADAYIAELESLDDDVAELVAGLSDEQKVLITNHEVFAYFADNYGFEVVGTVIPSGSTLDGTSAASLVELAEAIEEEGVAAIFSDTSSSDELVQALADEVGDIAVVELFTESLGGADSEGATYIDMVRYNATSITEALAS